LAVANPGRTVAGEPKISENAPEDDHESEYSIEGIRIRSGLWYSPNHMWLDIGGDGTLHVGIDDFLAKILGPPENLSYVTTKGTNRPTAVITVRGADLQLVFPNTLHIATPNSYLRTNPSKLASDPYTLGWLFEGTEVSDQLPSSETTSRRGLITGSAALSWMKEEIRRMTQLVHTLAQLPDHQGRLLFADGGCFHHDLLKYLSREEMLNLFNEFFSPLASWRK
jgi:glycine cleavage system H protein